jgi:hypothetical protein
MEIYTTVLISTNNLALIIHFGSIDFYKQPCFDHPFWKNTTFEVELLMQTFSFSRLSGTIDITLTFQECHYR